MVKTTDAVYKIERVSIVYFVFLRPQCYYLLVLTYKS